MSEEAHTSRA